MCKVLDDQLRNSQNGTSVVDVQDLFQRFTFDSIGEIAFGINFNSLLENNPVVKSFDDASSAISERFSDSVWLVCIFKLKFRIEKI